MRIVLAVLVGLLASLPDQASTKVRFYSASTTNLGDPIIEVTGTAGTPTPGFVLTFPVVMQVSDQIYIEKNVGVPLDLDGVGYHVVTAPEVAGANITFTYTTLTSGSYSFRVKLVRGPSSTNWSPAAAWVVP